MASTEEVLSTLLADDYIHSSIQFLIDENMRTVTVPPEGVVLGVTGDKDVNRINFKMVRFYDGLDLSTFQIRINYVNANGDANYYQVTDTTVEEDYILFTWLVSSDAAAYKGTVSFAARLYTVEDTIVKESFNSTVATAEVLEGIIVDEYMPPDAQQDLIALLMSQIEFPAGVGRVDANSAGTGEIFNDYERNIATGSYSHAEGYYAVASGQYSHAEGRNTKASSDAQHVSGKFNVEDSTGKYAVIVGNGTADDSRSNALTVDWSGNIECGTVNGVDVTQISSGGSGSGVGKTDGDYSEIFNCYEDTTYGFFTYKKNVASGGFSHAEGAGTTASGERAHAEGYNTTASGEDAHAEGYNTTASESYAHAEGNGTTASGGYGSHAEGYNTTASGSTSHAEGWCTTASGSRQHVQGQFNVDDSSSKYAMIIGNGTKPNALSNGFTVDWDGNIQCGKTDSSGNLTTNGTINGIDIVALAARVAALEGTS